ncbi:MAG: hypothetical protein P8X98_17725 [Woeseiaceae bacterium]
MAVDGARVVNGIVEEVPRNRRGALLVTTMGVPARGTFKVASQ